MSGYGKLKSFNSIDLMKFIMSVCVVAIHTSPLILLSDTSFLFRLYNNVLSLAVPFFFITSGFMIFRKTGTSVEENIKRIDYYIFKTIKLYLFWTIVYLPVTMYGYRNVNFILALRKFFVGILFIGENFYSYQLWYLLGLIYALFIFKILIKLNISKSSILLLAFVSFIISISMTWLTNNIELLSGVERYVAKLIVVTFYNGRIFSGIIYVGFGMVLARGNVKMDRYKSLFVLICTILLKSILYKTFISEILTIAATASLFVFLINIDLKDARIYPMLRYFSLINYFTHMFIMFLYGIILNDFTKGMQLFLVTMSSTTLLTLVTYNKGSIIKDFKNKLMK